MPSFIVNAKYDGYSVRDYLRSVGVSSSVIKKIKYTSEGIILNEQRVHTNDIVHTGDIASFSIPAETECYVLPQDLPLDIVYESMDTIVLNKKAGQVVHPTRGYNTDTLANAYCGLMQSRGTVKPFRPINRLDRNTSGLVLCAQNVISASFLSQNVSKVYYAIVEGKLPIGKGVINEKIDMCSNSIIKRCVSSNGKCSITEYEVLAANANFSYVKVMPITGRTHQIRVHFSYIGYPLVGDDLYGGSTELMKRHALHCAEITFKEQYEKDAIKIIEPLPRDMSTLLESIN